MRLALTRFAVSDLRENVVNQSTLKYLAARFSQIDCEEIAAANELIRKAQAAFEAIERSSQAEHALYHRLWGYVSGALDHNNFSPEHADALSALEAEMAGRTLTIRLSLGWITRSATGPTEFPALENFMN